jgi:putative transposase
MCSVLKVSRGGFYKWTVSTPSKRSIENQKLAAEVLQAFENSKRIYGSPRITLEPHKKDIKISRPRVARIMQKAELRSIVKKKFKITPILAINFLSRKMYMIEILNLEC